jgi:hypothetical protein
MRYAQPSDVFTRLILTLGILVRGTARRWADTTDPRRRGYRWGQSLPDARGWGTEGRPTSTTTYVRSAALQAAEVTRDTMSAIPPKADMCTALARVCYGP